MTKTPMVCALCVFRRNIYSDLATEKSARGIPGFKLNDGTFTEWKVQGKLGGYTA